MEAKEKELLRHFQCDYNRGLEETFAQTFSENENVRLFFINENEAFTDGRNIVVDPAADELFADRNALDKTGEYLGWPKVVLIDPWNALRIITRSQTLHECLHILYSDFPCRAASDPKCRTINEKKVMALVSNIIEDSYIESVGCSYYDNIELFLKFGRICRLFAKKPSEGTSERAFQNNTEEKSGRIVAYLEYMCGFLLYPMVKQLPPPEAIAEYVQDTKQLFLDGSAAPSPAERYQYSSQIFDRIRPLIPDDTEEMKTEVLKQHISGMKTHSPDASTIGQTGHAGRTQTITVRLFADLAGNPREDAVPVDQLMAVLQEYAMEKKAALSIVTYAGKFVSFTGKDYDCAVIHNHIKIHENHPRINLNLRKAYQNIYARYKISIRSYSSRFAQLLKAHAAVRDDKYKFGEGISSRLLGDPEKRYWYRSTAGTDVPDMAVMLLIDGSGSMAGQRCTGAMHSAIILHEVLKRQGITHAIVEHRASFTKPEIDMNILVDFSTREEEKLNLMQIHAYGDNRDGLALYWAEKYIGQQTDNEYKLIIVLSDGVPAHEADDYYPPVSTKDTANAVKKIRKRGTDIIAISLDDEGEFDCYEQLKEIYPNLIACNDLNRLTGQLLGVIAKVL